MLNDVIKGHLILVMGPTGSGKGTILSHVLAMCPEVYFSVSCTTRVPRPGEVHGRDYYFIDREEFMRRVDAEEFLEWAEFGGNLYGTLKSEVTERLIDGQIIINEIEIQGIEIIKKIISDDHLTTLYIEAGDWETLKARALARAPMSEEELTRRYARYLEEIKTKPYADVVIENTEGKLEDAKAAAVDVVKKIIATHSRI